MEKGSLGWIVLAFIAAFVFVCWTPVSIYHSWQYWKHQNTPFIKLRHPKSTIYVYIWQQIVLLILTYNLLYGASIIGNIWWLDIFTNVMQIPWTGLYGYKSVN